MEGEEGEEGSLQPHSTSYLGRAARGKSAWPATGAQGCALAGARVHVSPEFNQQNLLSSEQRRRERASFLLNEHVSSARRKVTLIHPRV